MARSIDDCSHFPASSRLCDLHAVRIIAPLSWVRLSELISQGKLGLPHRLRNLADASCSDFQLLRRFTLRVRCAAAAAQPDTVKPTSTTTLRYIGCSQDSESFSYPAREPRALNRPVAHPLQTTKNDGLSGLSYGRLRQLPNRRRWHPQSARVSAQSGNFTLLSPIRTPSFVRLTGKASTPSSIIWMTFRKLSAAAG